MRLAERFAMMAAGRDCAILMRASTPTHGRKSRPVCPSDHFSTLLEVEARNSRRMKVGRNAGQFSLVRRLWEKADRDPHTGCWAWTGYVDTDSGYGFTSAIELTGRYGPVGVHRVSYALFVGHIPADMQVHHVCRNRLCFNPDHLQLLSATDHNREHFGETCPRGHGPEHWKMRESKPGVYSRYCRECDNIRQRANRRRRGLPCYWCGETTTQKHDHEKAPECRACYHKHKIPNPNGSGAISGVPRIEQAA